MADDFDLGAVLNEVADQLAADLALAFDPDLQAWDSTASGGDDTVVPA
jgi:hypothetical protein